MGAADVLVAMEPGDLLDQIDLELEVGAPRRRRDPPVVGCLDAHVAAEALQVPTLLGVRHLDSDEERNLRGPEGDGGRGR